MQDLVLSLIKRIFRIATQFENKPVRSGLDIYASQVRMTLIRTPPERVQKKTIHQYCLHHLPEMQNSTVK